ncbi:MAG: type IX secretion system sortase PorU [Crocinitomicaceae bacterium]
MKFTKILYLFFVAGLVFTIPSMVFGQQKEIHFLTTWNKEVNKCVPCDFNEIDQQVYSSTTLDLGNRGNYNYSYQLLDVEFKEVELPSYYDKKALSKNIDLSIDFSISRSQNFITATYHPIILQNGIPKLIEKLTVLVSYEANEMIGHDRAATFASSSVLSGGDWYKIGVDRSGVFKIDYSFLNSIGVNVSGLNPNHINIYGNHFPEMPIYNYQYRPDDLLKNAIYISGDGDNSFDASDYILFYASGPDVVIPNTYDFQVEKNHLDSLSYYFIHISSADTPKRIGSVNNSVNTVTHSVSSFNDYYLHENNDENLLKSGEKWFGEFFDIELTKSFSVPLTDLNTASPIQMKTVLASEVKSGTGSLQVMVNGVQQDNISCSTFSGSLTVAMLNNSTVNFTSSTGSLSVTLNFNRSSPASTAWLDYMLFNYERNATLASDQILIRDIPSVGIGNVVQYSVASSSAASQFWEVTDPSNAAKINGSLAGSNYTFSLDADSLRSIVAFNTNQAYTPLFLKKISNQNLHALSQVEYVIVAHESLIEQANRLADLHRAHGMSVHVADIQQVYNEFSGGMADPIAIRWFVKMFYDRAAGDPNLMPKYLCLFGDGSYDPLNRIEGNNYLLPTYQSPGGGSNVNYSESFTSDDFFGILDDSEQMLPSDMIDVGVGRIPVSDLANAKQVVDKIEHYMNFGSYLYSNVPSVQTDENGYASTFGDWRNKLVLMADDENSGTFVTDCEELSDSTEELYPEMNVVKIYLDAYKQLITSGGQRYPEVVEAVNQNITRGALVFNYVGHGGETGLTLERAVTYAMIENWVNVNNMCVFISATCEFSRFDDMERESAGERTLTSPYGGAVGLLTTTRLVYISLNSELVRKLYTVLFAEENGEPLALGEIIRRTKNITSNTNNKRNFTLLGDPALKLGKPDPLIVTDSVNGVSITATNDTLKALSKVTISGHVGDAGGNLMSSYNGIVYPTVYDKKKIKKTLGQDLQSPVLSFDTQTNIIYKGKATVTNGYFKFSFVVPKDIDYSIGKGKISYYSHDSNSNNYGYDTTILVGGVDPNGIVDNVGPDITLYMNDPNFANGGLTDESPLFIAEVVDENGINTTGNGIGHDITLIVDGNTSDPIILNNYYEADLDTYQSGKVTYQFNGLEPGPHSLVFKVWDVNNNSAEATLDFVVVEEQDIGISHLLNYPNPFTTNTDFFFEHNQISTSMDVKIEIFTVSGKLVKTIIENVNTSGFRSEGINWNGRDDYGDKLARGVYVYKLSIETAEGKRAHALEKLVIL